MIVQLSLGVTLHRQSPLTPKQAALIHPLAPEFSDTPNVPGILSMARGDDPGSATSSFFICTGECRGLDNKYAVFGRVVRGMDVVTAIAATAVDGETPRTPIVGRKISIQR